MMPGLGAVSSAFDLLKSLTTKKPSAPPTGVTQSSTEAFSATSTPPATPQSSGTKPGSFSSLQSGVLSPDMMNALISAQDQASNASTASASGTKSGAMKDLFSQLDSDGNGEISQSEFEDKLGAGGTNTANADSVFGKLDKNHDGSISLDEMASALKADGKDRHHHAANSNGTSGSGGSGGSSTDTLLQALQGASSTSTTNSDGSTTTSLTYADGSKVTLTTPAASTASSNATSSYNFVEQMISREAKAISASATPQLSISA